MIEQEHAHSNDIDREQALAGLFGGTVYGAALGIVAGVGFDQVDLNQNPVAEGATRYVSGNAHIITEALGAQEAAMPYVKGQLFGSVVGVIVHATLHITQNKTGLDPYGPVGTVTAAAFAHAENIGGMIADFRDRVQQDGLKKGWRSFRRSPYQQGNAISIAALIAADAAARAAGFYPDSNSESGIETGIAGPLDSIAAGAYARWRLRHRGV